MSRLIHAFNDLNTGRLSTEQFSEASTYGIVGPIPSDINEIKDYTFETIQNTTLELSILL